MSRTTRKIYAPSTGSDMAVESTAGGDVQLVEFVSSAGTELGTSGAPVRVDPTGTTAQPVTCAAIGATSDAKVQTDTTGTVVGFLRGLVSWFADLVGTVQQTPAQTKGIRVLIGPGDVISNLPVVMQYDHHQIHEGESTRFQDLQVSLGTATVKYGLTVPTYAVTIRAPHLIVTCDVYNGTVLVQLYESATFTNGSTVNGHNRNRNSTTTPGMTIATGVTSTNGTLIDSFYVGSGSRSAASNRASVEWVLKSNTIYRVDVIGQVAGTAAIVGFDSYEDLGV